PRRAWWSGKRQQATDPPARCRHRSLLLQSPGLWEEANLSTTEALTGAEWLARTLAVNGTSHVFFIDAVLRRTLIELGALGVTRVLAHAEKSAAYMADGYARIAGRPGICFAQSVGA